MKDRLVVLDAATVYAASDPQWQLFADAGYDVTVYDRTSAADIHERCRGAKCVLTNKVPLDAAAIAALPELRYIGVLATGYNIVDVEAARAAGVVVTNVPAYSTASVAQQAIALLLACVNAAETYSRAVHDGRWAASPDFSFRINDWHELSGKTIGIIGFGNTGSATARIAAALGMKVAVFTSKPQEALPEGYVKADLDTIFKTADVVSLHCPLNDQTRQMVDAERLASMKPGAILINTARGPLVDEQALADALNSGRLAAAGVDVLCQEPPVDGSPLASAEHCVVTPHIAWASVEARRRLFDIALANVVAFTCGHPQNVV